MLHVLPAGARFDLTTRTLLPPEPGASTRREAAEMAEAGQDLRQLARDIAADDVSPSTLRRRQRTHPQARPRAHRTRTEPR